MNDHMASLARTGRINPLGSLWESIWPTARRNISRRYQQPAQRGDRGWVSAVAVALAALFFSMVCCVGPAVVPKPNEPDAAENRSSVAERESQETPTALAVLATHSTVTQQPTATALVVPRITEEIRGVEGTRPVQMISTPTLMVAAAQDASPSPVTATPLPPTLTSTPVMPPAAPTAWPASVPATAVIARVVAVVDGVTLAVLIDGQPDSVRYIGVDSPSTNSQIGAQATSANAALVADQVVYLLPDTSDRDQNDRLLRYVFLADGRLVNEELVLQGHVLSVANPPDIAYQADLDTAQDQAQADGAGMWQTLAWATESANIRTGPGTDYTVVDGAQPGEALDIVGRSADGDWFKLGAGGWIFAELVSNPPSNLPVVQAPAP